MSRSKWAMYFLDQAQRLATSINETMLQIAVIKQSVDISLVHLRHHSAALEKSFETTIDFAVNLEKDAAAGSNWREVCDKLKKININTELLSSKDENKSLLDWLNVEDLEAVDRSFNTDQDNIRNMLHKLKSEVDKVVDQGTKLDKDAKAWVQTQITPVYEENSKSTTEWQHYNELAEDVTTLVQKVQDDCEYVATLSDSPINIKTASRLMQLHEREFLPNIKSMTEELWQIAKVWLLARTYAQKKLVIYLQKVSRLQSQTSPLRPQLSDIGKRLKHLEEQRVILARAIDMPYLYGALLLEFVRRKEWLSEVKIAVSKSAEYMAGWIEDELKHRTRWKRQYGGSLGVLKRIGGEGTNNLPAIDVSFANSSEEKIFDVTKKNFEDYLEVLKKLDFPSDYQELKKQYDIMNRTPPISLINGAQRKLNKLFKSASISEYNHSEISFQRARTPTSDSEDAVIQGYEARIRKLEDLLHRNQFRDTWTSKFQSPEFPSAFKKDQHSAEEFKKLQDKIQLLEKENGDCKDEIATLKKENERLKENVNKASEETRMMKSDLFANIRVKEQEFNNERRIFNEEIAELKGKVDDLEIEVESESDRAIAFEKQASNLQSEVETMKKATEQAEFKLTALNRTIEEKTSIENKYLKLEARFELLYSRAKDISQRLFTSYKRSCDTLECLGLQASKELDENGELISMKIQRVKGLGRRSSARNSSMGEESGVLETAGANDIGGGVQIDPNVLYWLDAYYNESDDEYACDPAEDVLGDNNSLLTSVSSVATKHKRKLSTGRELRYRKFIDSVYMDYDLFKDSVTKRFNDVEHLARKLQKEARSYRERAHMSEQQNRQKLAFKTFQKGDLALFLPTRDQTRDPNPWAAFNVGAPHFFLKPSEELQLENREWLVGRITNMEERVVDRASERDGDNPFELSDGLRWHLIEAKEER